MTSRSLLTLSLAAALAGSLHGATISAAAQVAPVQGADAALPALPATPAPAGDVLFAQPFEVDAAWDSDFRADHPSVSRGFVVVLRADAALAFPRQVACPVLTAGEMPCEVIDPVQGSEIVVAIVPVLGNADLALDSNAFSALSLFWADPALPEQVTAASAREALAGARRAGVAEAWSMLGVAEREARAAKAREFLAPAMQVKDREALVALARRARESVLAR